MNNERAKSSVELAEFAARPSSTENKALRLAQVAEEAEREGSPWQAILANPKIVVCCLFGNTGALMYGFDNLSLSISLSMPPFQKVYGSQLPNGTYIIPAYWQSLWNALAQVSTMIGAASAGLLQDYFGRRKSLAIGAAISAAGVAVLYTSSTPAVFLAGKMINGIALGICLTVGQTYISEITPLQFRGIALSLYTFSMNLGYLIAASIAFTRVNIPDRSAYLNLFAAEWVWPALIVAFVFFIPESPYWLAMKGDMNSAQRMLERLSNKGTDTVAALQRIIALNEEEKRNRAAAQGASSLECFKGTNWRRTRIILYCNSLSQVLGASFSANGPYFLVQAGMSPAKTSMMIEIGIGFGIASSVISGYLMSICGRRPLILSGVWLATVFFFIMGVAGCFPHSRTALWVVGIALQLLWWTYGPGIGPAVAMAGEISSVRLRSKSLAIGFTFNYFFSTVWNVAIPYMFNEDQGNLGGKIGWIYFGFCVATLVVIFLEFPETKGRSFQELNNMFEARVPTRKFKTY